MRIHRRQLIATASLSILLALSGTVSLLRADTGSCGGANITIPFTDVAGSPFFCQIAEAYFTGQTSGTSATTFSPAGTVDRGQMVAFLTRTLDKALNRGSQRTISNRFWTPKTISDSAVVSVGNAPSSVQSDGEDLWVANQTAGTVTRVRASDMKVLGTWTGASAARGVLVAKGKVYIAGGGIPGKLYSLDPTQAPGAITLEASSLGHFPTGIAFDGRHIWTANGVSNGDGISIIDTTGNAIGLVTTITNNLVLPRAIVFDGSSIWVTDIGDGTLKKLNSGGGVAQTIPVGSFPESLAFDGMNLWVANHFSDSVTVVRASNGAVLATLTGNGLNRPQGVAFDGERILVTNANGESVSLFKATDLTALGSFPLGAGVQVPATPFAACSDGRYFYFTLRSADQLARF